MPVPDSRKYFEPFRPDQCDNCGQCLSRCPVLQFSPQRARREIVRLRHGGMPTYLLRWCQTCFACNLNCPNQANPAQLILDRFNAYYRVHGVPAWSSYFQPHAHLNFRTYAMQRIPQDERDLVARWEDLTPCEEFVYPGCNVCSAAYLTQTKLLDGLNIRGGLDVCCGEMYYRTGQYDRLAEVARRLNAFVDRLGARRMMILCTAGYNMFTSVLPRFGFNPKLEITSYVTWLGERLDRGELPLTQKVDMTVTVQDACYGKMFGPDYYRTPRRLLEAAGVRVREMSHHMENSLCCGIGAGFPVKMGYHPIPMMLSSGRVLGEALSTRADAVATYCAGCMMSLCTARVFMPSPQPVRHLLQILSEAAGETPPDRNMERARLIVEGILLNQFPRLVSSRRYRTIPLGENPKG